MKRISAMLAFLLCLLQATPSFTAENPPKPVSILQLISDPEKYEGKGVFGIGFLDMSAEESLLFLHQEDYEHVILANAIWIEPSKEMERDADKLNLRYVKFVGTFHVGHRGRHSYYQSGGIGEVTACRVWSDPQTPLRGKMSAEFDSSRVENR